MLGEDVEIIVTAADETNTRIQPKRIIRQLGNEPGLVALVGVQSNQYPHAMDIARPLRAAGVQVCIGGFHFSSVAWRCCRRLRRSSRKRWISASRYLRARPKGALKKSCGMRGTGHSSRSITTWRICRRWKACRCRFFLPRVLSGPRVSSPASMPAAAARFSALFAPLLMCRGGSQGGARRMR